MRRAALSPGCWAPCRHWRPRGTRTFKVPRLDRRFDLVMFGTVERG